MNKHANAPRRELPPPIPRRENIPFEKRGKAAPKEARKRSLRVKTEPSSVKYTSLKGQLRHSYRAEDVDSPKIGEDGLEEYECPDSEKASKYSAMINGRSK